MKWLGRLRKRIERAVRIGVEIDEATLGFENQHLHLFGLHPTIEQEKSMRQGQALRRDFERLWGKR